MNGIHPPTAAPRTTQHLTWRVVKHLAAAYAVLTLAACSLLPTPDAQTTYGLPTFTPVAPSPTASDWVLRVDTPLTTAPLDARQVIVQYPNASLASWRGILWSDRAPVLLRERLAQAFADSGLFRAVLSGNTSAAATAELVLTLRAFYVIAPDADARVEVRVQAQLIHAAEVLGQQGFTQTQAVDDAHDPDAVVSAFGRATDALAAAMSVWLQDRVRAQTQAGVTP